MSVTFTPTQKQRLSELNAKDKTLNKIFNDNVARDKYYREEEARLIGRNRKTCGIFFKTAAFRCSLLSKSELLNGSLKRWNLLR